MKPWETLGQARTPDGATMTLTRSGRNTSSVWTAST